MSRRPRSSLLAGFAALSLLLVSLPPADANATVQDGPGPGLENLPLISAIAAGVALGMDVWTGVEMSNGEGVDPGLRIGTGVVGGLAVLVGGFSMVIGAMAESDDAVLYFVGGGFAVATGTLGIVLASIADDPADAVASEVFLAPWIGVAGGGTGTVAGTRVRVVW